MRKRLFIPLLFLLMYPFFGYTQNHWLTIEEASYNQINFKLQVIHQPSLSNDSWIRLIVDNQSTSPQEIIQSSIKIKIQAFSKSDDIVKQGMFSSENPSEFYDDLAESLFELEKLKLGENTISLYPSAYGASILGLPNDKFYTAKADVHFLLQLDGEEPLLVDWDGIQVDFEWYRPNELQIRQLQSKLNRLLQKPNYNSSHFYTLNSLLQEETIYQNLNNKNLILALDTYKGFPNSKLALLYFTNDIFYKDKKILNHYEDLIRTKNNIALTDLKSMPLIWKDSYITLLWDWMQAANLSTKLRIIDVLYLNQSKWIKNKAFTKQLSDHLLQYHGDILYALPENLSLEQLKLWASLATALGKTGDAAAIGILCPFLKSKTELLSRDIIIFSDSYEIPRPLRACDIALEAILLLQQKEVYQTYQKAGYLPPYWNGDAEIIITRIRDDLIREMGYSSTCQY